MIADLLPYAEVKATGLPWLPAIPAHWQVRRIKALLREVDRRTTTGSERLLSLRMREGVVDHLDAGGKPVNPEELIGYKIVEPGAFVMNRMRAAMGLFGIVPKHGLVSPDYAVFHPYSGAHQKYLLYLFKTPMLGQIFHSESKGLGTGESGFLRLYTDRLGAIAIPLPPSDEQQAIVRFLDWHGALTTKAILAKQRLIKLLEEQKRTVIHRTVTHGLIGTAIKPSGIPWVRETPKHWHVAALRHRYHQCLGKMLDAKRIRGEHLVPYLRNIDVQWDQIRTIDLPNMDIFSTEHDRYLVRKGDLLVCEGGEVGRAAIWDGVLEICGFQKALHRLRPRNPENDCPRFLMYVLFLASLSGAFADGHESTISHLTGEKLRQHRFPFPERAEQSAIVAYLDTAFANIDRATSDLERQMALLREFRARLIAEVMTGKLDVRTAAASLPETIEAPESPDESGSVDDLEETEGDDPELAEAAA